MSLDPDVSHLGPDAASLGQAGTGAGPAGSSAPLKARLLDQSRVAGIGNLIADEVLWRAGLVTRCDRRLAVTGRVAASAPPSRAGPCPT